MKKELKDYLHLYLGCKVKCPKLSGWIYSQKIVLLTEYFWLSNYEKELIPILRPLSDITEKEAIAILGYNEFLFLPFKDWKTDFVKYEKQKVYTPQTTIKLISKHFDLFDLIPSGLAIDATTLKQKS